MWCPTKKLGPIGSAVLTFIENKQTNKHPDKPILYIDIKKERKDINMLERKREYRHMLERLGGGKRE